MTTEEDYNKIANAAYNVDSLKVKVPLTEGKPILGGQYKILKTEDNTANGMQAMAVAPVIGQTIDGKPIIDDTQITIAYAGTNFSDEHDRDTDMQSVIMGGSGDLSTDTEYIFIEGSDTPIIVDQTKTTNQIETARAFADQIISDYPEATISFTGHSLGGYLALITAAETQNMATTFNAPSPVNNLSDEAKEYIKANQALYYNYRVRGDYIGNFGAYFEYDDELGISKWVYGSDTGDIGGYVYFHGLDRYQFNEDGQVIDSEGNPINTSGAVVAGVIHRMSDYYSLKSVRKKEGGGLSANEEFFLDSEQSAIISAGLVEATQTALEAIQKARDDAFDQAEALYQATKDIPFSVTELSSEEVQEAYAEAGVTYDSIVGEIQEHFDGKVTKAEAIVTTYSNLRSQIQSGVEAALAADSSLAGEFNQWSVK